VFVLIMRDSIRPMARYNFVFVLHQAGIGHFGMGYVGMFNGALMGLLKQHTTGLAGSFGPSLGCLRWCVLEQLYYFRVEGA
jgi:hypothetical protein